MKLSIAIADTHALPSAFVVYRGFQECIPKAASLGFDGVELALKRAEEVNTSQLQGLLDDNGLEVSCISTGQVYADGGLMFTQEDKSKREQVKTIFREFIDLAENFGKIVNIGRVRGQIGNRPKAHVEDLFIEVARELCAYALPKKVTLILEPVNRYEIDFINSVEEGVQLMEKVHMPNMMLMPDVFHMNIEDKTIGPELARNIEHIKYIHFADSNRLAPGQGHTDFEKIFNNLLLANYDGWISAEILPKPNPDVAAKQTADFLLPLIKAYNQKRSAINLVQLYGDHKTEKIKPAGDQHG
jgi:5-keto-L-gluconate epimerase